MTALNPDPPRRSYPITVKPSDTAPGAKRKEIVRKRSHGAISTREGCVIQRRGGSIEQGGRCEHE